MRTVRNLFPRLWDRAHLELALEDAARGKRRHSDVAWFLFRRDGEIARLSAELAAERWRPEGVDVLLVRDPKPRLIARTPIADRVVHTAIVLLLEPVFLRSLPGDAFACREGYGTHRGVLRLLELVRRHRFAVHLDVKTYFPSIDLGILRRLLAERIRDDRFLRVVDRVLDVGGELYRRPAVRALAGLGDGWPPAGCGLPIGAYTSQLFAAHVYLAGFDHFVKRELKIPGYRRYVDDLFLFGDRRADLRRWRGAVAEWLAEHRRLRLKHPEARILSCHGHLDGLGYRIRRDGVEALPRALRRMRRRVAAEMAASGDASQRVDIARSIASTAGAVLFLLILAGFQLWSHWQETVRRNTQAFAKLAGLNADAEARDLVRMQEWASKTRDRSLLEVFETIPTDMKLGVLQQTRLDAVRFMLPSFRDGDPDDLEMVGLLAWVLDDIAAPLDQA